MSRLVEFQQCQQRFDLRYNQNLESRADEKPEARFGTAIHAYLKALYLNEQPEVDWTGYEPVGRTHEHETQAYALRLIAAYQKKYADDKLEVLAVEEEFGYELAGGKHLLLGRWDLVVRLPIGGEAGTIYHMQHKTVAANTALASYVRSYDLAWHERLYVAALKHRYPSEQVGGTVLNVLRKAKKISPENDLVHYFVPVSDSLIDRFEAEAIETIDEIEKREAGEARWRQNERACMSYNRLCPYHDLCLQQPIEIEEVYKQRELDYVDAERERLKACQS